MRAIITAAHTYGDVSFNNQVERLRRTTQHTAGFTTLVYCLDPAFFYLHFGALDVSDLSSMPARGIVGIRRCRFIPGGFFSKL